MEPRLSHLIRTASSLQKTLHIEPILKGFSTDRKFHVILSDGEQRVLRVADREQWEQKKAEFQVLQSLQARKGVKASRPIELGLVDEFDICFMVLSYVAGEDAKDALENLTAEEQYLIGKEAGRQLALMHTIAAPSEVTDWYQRCYEQKHSRYVETYRACGQSIANADRILAFIDEHAAALQDTTSVFLHDDFHVGNLIVEGKHYAGAIDFNRFDWGDPVHDFTKLAFFSQEISTPFSIGQIDGYHERKGSISEIFWLRYCLYTAMAMFSSLVWTIRVIPQQTRKMQERIERISLQHDFFEQLVPDWYKRM